MADPVVQVKIPELQSYVALDPSDPNYVNPGQVYIPVHHPAWSRPRKMAVTGAAVGTEDSEITTVSRAVGKLTGLASRNVSVTFPQQLVSSSMIERVDVYRYVTFDGQLIKQQVQHYFASESWFSSTGFALTITDDEDLSGIIITYEFIAIIEA